MCFHGERFDTHTGLYQMMPLKLRTNLDEQSNDGPPAATSASRTSISAPTSLVSEWKLVPVSRLSLAELFPCSRTADHTLTKFAWPSGAARRSWQKPVY
jgi:hypothetical protein